MLFKHAPIIVRASPSGVLTFDNQGTNATLTNGNEISMCDGDAFCIDVEFTDSDAGDVLHLGTNALDILPGATFTQTGTNPATGTLCWTYTDGYTGSLISITASDSACPTPGNANYLINLDIPPPLNASLDDTICGDQIAELQAFGTEPVTWSVISGDPIVIGTNFSCNPCTEPEATPSITTTYEVIDGSTCVLRDTITVVVQQNNGGITAEITTDDVLACEGDCFTIDGIATETYSGTTQTPFSNSTQYYIASNTTFTSTINVSGLNMDYISIGSIESVCMDIDHTWDSDLDIYLVCPDGTTFMLTTDNGGSGNDFENTCFTIDATTQINSGSAPFNGDYVPEGGVLSSAMVGCTANGNWGLQVTDDAGGDTGYLYEWSITFNDDVPNDGPASIVGWDNITDPGNTADIVDPSSATSQLCATADGTYVMYVYNVDNCWASDTLNVTLTSSLDPGEDSTIYLCKEGPQIDLFTYLGGTPEAGGNWFNSAGMPIDPVALPDTLASDVYEYQVGTGCIGKAYITVNIIEVSATSVIDDSDCQACNGSIEITPSGGLGTYTYDLTDGTISTSQVDDPLFLSLCGGTPGTLYDLTVTDSIGCVYNYSETVVDDNFPEIQTINTVDSDCGLDNGEVSATTITSGGTATYTYLVEGVGTTYESLPLQYLAPSVPTYNLIVQDNFGCTDTLEFTINEINPPVIQSVDVVNNECYGVSEGTITVNGNNLTHYSIDGGNNVQTSNVFTDLAAGTYTITAYSSDPATTTACSVTETNIVISEPDALVISVTSDPNPATICPGDPITLSVSATGGNGNYEYVWSDGGSTVYGTSTSIVLNPTVNTDVYATVMEQNALNLGTYCPQTDSDVINVTMPTPIYPMVSSDTTDGCYPVSVTLANTSTNSSEIATTVWDLSPYGEVTTVGNASVIQTYDEVGVYNVGMTITSIYGCVYDTVYTNYIEAYDYPDADFTMNPIPADVYNTEVDFMDLSSDDVVLWSWNLNASATPNSSSDQNPTAIYPEGVPNYYPVTLIVTNENGCQDSITRQVQVVNDVLIYAPNVFTPDGDDYNETWRVYISGVQVDDFHLTIFNRWGETVFESYNPDGEWNGTYGGTNDILDGTFVWVVYANDAYNDKKYEFRGHVTILK